MCLLIMRFGWIPHQVQVGEGSSQVKLERVNYVDCIDWKNSVVFYHQQVSHIVQNDLTVYSSKNRKWSAVWLKV